MKNCSGFERYSFETDELIPNGRKQAAFGGIYQKTVDFVKEHQLYDAEHWNIFEQQLGASYDDRDNGWRGEYWGKTMMGATLLYEYTKDAKLYSILENSVKVIIAKSKEDKRLSSYSVEKEFNGWDVWGRKYVVLGLQSFYEVTTDEALRAEIVTAMCGVVDYLIEKIGYGKIDIVETSNEWMTLNSVSSLEAVVRLYNLTGEQKYFDFAQYIVERGENSPTAVFRWAMENELYPYEYPTTKAYEMISCFEGLLEYYRVTKIEKYKQAAINFADRVIKTDVTLIGGIGCTHELFDNSGMNQTDVSHVGKMQENCVSVAWMRFCAQLLKVTADPKYADCIEQTFYNVFLGTVNTRLKVRTEFKELEEVLTFDSYSPIRAGYRGIFIAGLKRMNGGHFYSCCTAFGPAGLGIMPRNVIHESKNGFYINHYLSGNILTATPSGNQVELAVSTKYPYDEKVDIKFNCETAEEYCISFRIPKWSAKSVVCVNGEAKEVESGYFGITREWKNGDTVTLEFDAPVSAVYPRAGAPGRDCFVAFKKGCICLCVDNEYDGDCDSLVLELKKHETEHFTFGECKIDDVGEYKVQTEIVNIANGNVVKLVDYASAGKSFDEKLPFAVWLSAKIVK